MMFQNNNKKMKEYEIDTETIFGVKNSKNYNQFIKEAEMFARETRNTNTNQIRIFFDEILKINEDNLNQKMAFLKIKLAYAKGRNVIKDDFYCQMVRLIDKTTKENLDIFRDFMEAYVAYNKMHGGK